MANFKKTTAIRLINVLLKKESIITVYVLVAVAAALKQYLHHSYNNYLIFKYVYWHTVNFENLYQNYAEYADSNHYGPLFSMIIAPFAMLPDGLGMILWNVSNVLILLWGIYSLPISSDKKALVGWICIHEALTALLSFQFNIAMTGMILLSFSTMEKQHSFRSAVVIMIGFMIKLYGIVAIAFFFFYRKKFSLIISLIISLTIFLCLPMLISSPSYILQSYQDWFNALVYKSSNNELNLMADISFLGFLRKTTGLHINVLYGCAFAGLILLTILLRKQYRHIIDYKLGILAFVLLCLVLFNTNVESPTYIIGFVGVAIWFIINKRSWLVWSLFIFAIILTSLSPSDLFPKNIRDTYIIPYALKAFPCIIIWLHLSYLLLSSKFTRQQNF